MLWVDRSILDQWFSKCGARVGKTWEFVRNTNSQLHPRPAESGTLEVGAAVRFLSGPPMMTLCMAV